MAKDPTPFERLLAEMHGPPPKPYEHQRVDASLTKLVEILAEATDEPQGDE